MESKISIKWLSMYYFDERCDKEGRKESDLVVLNDGSA